MIHARSDKHSHARTNERARCVDDFEHQNGRHLHGPRTDCCFLGRGVMWTPLQDEKWQPEREGGAGGVNSEGTHLCCQYFSGKLSMPSGVSVEFDFIWCFIELLAQSLNNNNNVKLAVKSSRCIACLFWEIMLFTHSPEDKETGFDWEDNPFLWSTKWGSNC